MTTTNDTAERAVPMPIGEPDWRSLYSCPTCHDTGKVVEGDGPERFSYACECEAAEQQPSGPTAERVKAIIEECQGFLPGWLVFCDGAGRETVYRVAIETSSPPSYSLRKEIPQVDGSTQYGEPYVVTLGEFRSCTCKGYEYSRQSPRSCRHLRTLSLALDSLANTAPVA